MSNINTGSDPIGLHHLAAGIDDFPDAGSAVSWAAIFAGAAGAAALSMLLLILGTGFGFSVVSPWTMEGVSATTFGFAAIAWLTFTQIAASGMGGYLAGRLRTKWMAAHTDEVYFRDTAHGFLTWAVASLLTAAVLTTVVGSIIGVGVRAGSEVGDGAARMAAGENGSDETGNTIEYFVDSLFRGDFQSDPGGSDAADAQQTGAEADIPTDEVTRIFAQALRSGTLPQEDERYIGRLISQRTDLSQQEGEQRVSEGFENLQTTLEDAASTAREKAEEAREATAYAALWMFIALLIGAFTASLMAVFGGRQRDA